MNEAIGVALDFFAFFTSTKAGKTGLTVTVDVWRQDGTAVVTGGSATAIGGGLYKYTLASGSNTAEGGLVCVFKTTDTTVDQQHVPALWLVNKAGVENLDAAISSRLADASYTAPDNSGIGLLETAVASLEAAVLVLQQRLTSGRATLLDNLSLPQLASAVWDALAADYDTVGTKGRNSNASGAAADPLTNPVPGSYVSGTAGFALGRIGTGATEIVVEAPPVSVDGLEIDLVQGDSYTIADGRELTWTSTSWRDLTGATVTLYLGGPGRVVDYVATVIPPHAVSLELLAEQTALILGRHTYRLVAVWLDETVETLVSGMMNVRSH